VISMSETETGYSPVQMDQIVQYNGILARWLGNCLDVFHDRRLFPNYVEAFYGALPPQLRRRVAVKWLTEQELNEMVIQAKKKNPSLDPTNLALELQWENAHDIYDEVLRVIYDEGLLSDRGRRPRPREHSILLGPGEAQG
jgi:hypothetical protein